MLADYHLHTSFSADCDNNMEGAIQRAIELQLDEVCFTEHLDYGNKWDYPCDCEGYWREWRRCQERYCDQIGIRFGMEFGMQVYTIPRFQEIFARYPLDFVILSCHQIDGCQFGSFSFYKGKEKEQKACNRIYYEEILRLIEQYTDYSVLGHLDVIRRYERSEYYEFEQVKDLVEEILRRVIAQGKGIEVNTSSFRYKLPDLTPGREILKMYKELGGEILTIGSDAHTNEWIGCEIKSIQDELKEMGFHAIYTFDQMQPVRHEL